MQKLAGFIFCASIGFAALNAAFDSYGTVIEQVLIALVIVVAGFSLIGLFGVWKNIEVYSAQVFKLLGWALPLVTITNVVHFYIEYYDQSPWEGLLIQDSIRVFVTLMVGLLFLDKGRKQ